MNVYTYMYSFFIYTYIYQFEEAGEPGRVLFFLLLRSSSSLSARGFSSCAHPGVELRADLKSISHIKSPDLQKQVWSAGKREGKLLNPAILNPAGSSWRGVGRSR